MDDWILEGLQIQIDKEEVFKMIDCYEDSPVYEEVAEEYDEILEDMRAVLKPIGIIGLGEITENIATENTRPEPELFLLFSVWVMRSKKKAQNISMKEIMSEEC